MVYLVAGLLFNKFHKGATGKEMIPNVNFWTDFPLLVKVRNLSVRQRQYVADLDLCTILKALNGTTVEPR